MLINTQNKNSLQSDQLKTHYILLSIDKLNNLI